MMPLRSRRSLIVGVFAIIVLVIGWEVLVLLEDRPMLETSRIKLTIVAPGRAIAVGDSNLGMNEGSIMLTGNEPSCFELPEDIDPTEAFRQHIAPDGKVLAQPNWQVYGPLGRYGFPHLFTENYVFENVDGKIDAVLIFIFRHVETRQMMAVPIRAHSSDSVRPVWLGTEKRVDRIDDWWHRSVLRQTVAVSAIDIRLGDQENGS